ncbi:hypothetical protein SPLC1_S531780 [Arthrospira platensis C1]|nr:hypothetical protein SPLC1_S531780 [Arthrospira platensis C1]
MAIALGVMAKSAIAPKIKGVASKLIPRRQDHSRNPKAFWLHV